MFLGGTVINTVELVPLTERVAPMADQGMWPWPPGLTHDEWLPVGQEPAERELA